MSELLFPDSVYKLRKGETKDAKETRLWKPVRLGKYYCAPRCGRGCTWAEFQLATKRAAALCKRLGKGWEPRVWENGGWHYQATKETAEVYAHHSAVGVSCSVWLQTEVGSHTTGGISAMMQVILDCPSENKLKATLKKALKIKESKALQLLAEVEAVRG